MIGEQLVSLPLFNQQTNNDNLLVTENKVIPPLAEILDNAIPRHAQTSLQVGEVPQTINEALTKIFPEQQYEEKSIQAAKEILGPITKELTPEELKCAVVEMQYLVETWLDDFERNTFDGLTLQELLHEKGRRI